MTVDGSVEGDEFGRKSPTSPRLRHPLEQDMDHSDEECDFRGRDERDRVDRPSGLSRSSPDDASTAPPSNETLLGTAFVTFMSFALLQLVFASVAGSEAMMGDGAAMTVDALTYLFNYCAERRKTQMEQESPQHRPGPLSETEALKEQLMRRKQVLQMEIIPPLLSVSTLLVITVVVVHKAIQTLVLDLHRSRSEQDDPNVNLMLTFSFLNLVLDSLNVFCFAKAKHLLGYTTVEHWDDDDDVDEERQQLRASLPHKSMVNGSQPYALVRAHSADEDAEDGTTTDGRGAAGGLLHLHQHPHAGSEHVNLNMCSAYTHVFADTLRSIAVLVAAVLAKLVPGVTSEEADATAAVFVSVLIVLSLVPLLQGLRRSVAELNTIMAIERQDILFPEQRVLATRPT